MTKKLQALNESQRLTLSNGCTEILNEFCRTTSGVQSATVATSDGLTVASTMGVKREGDKLSAISSSISALAAALTREVGHSEPDRVLLESDHGRVISIKVPTLHSGLVFTAVTDQNAVLGLLLWNSRIATEKLAVCAALDLG
jgi:uncharacterized protein